MSFERNARELFNVKRYLFVKFVGSKLYRSIWKDSDHLSTISSVQSEWTFPFNNFSNC